MPVRAASYCRVSSDAQEKDGTSLITQKQAIERYCTEQGYMLLPEHQYEDTWTGSEYRERPGLSAMREAIRSREVDVFVTYSLDRLSRNSGHLFIVVEEAEFNRVRFDCVTESFDDTHQGKLLRDVQGFVAAIEREKIIERTIRGRKSRIKDKGLLLPGSKPLYGYRWTDPTERGKLELHPDHAPVVLEVFEAVAAGMTLQSIANHLTERKVPTPTGASSTWRSGTLAHMLHHPFYKGEAFGWGWVKQVKGRSQQFDMDKAIPLPKGTVPAIVTTGLWDAAQAVLTRNKQKAVRNAREPEAALLRTGYVYCGHCGSRMSARPRSDGAYEYICRKGKHTNGDCVRPTISTKKLDTIVWNLVTGILTDPDIVRGKVEEFREIGEKPGAKEIGKIDRELAQLSKRQANLTNALSMLTNPDAMLPIAEQLDDLATARTSMLAERDQWLLAQQQWEKEQADLTSFEDWCSIVRDNLDGFTWEQKRMALDVLDMTAHVYKGNHTPRFEIHTGFGFDSVSNTT